MAINGQEYAWEDVQIVMLGRPVIGVVEISYKTMREKKNIMGRGSRPVARGQRTTKAKSSCCNRNWKPYSVV